MRLRRAMYRGRKRRGDELTDQGREIKWLVEQPGQRAPGRGVKVGTHPPQRTPLWEPPVPRADTALALVRLSMGCPKGRIWGALVIAVVTCLSWALMGVVRGHDSRDARERQVLVAKINELRSHVVRTSRQVVRLEMLNQSGVLPTVHAQELVDVQSLCPGPCPAHRPYCSREDPHQCTTAPPMLYGAPHIPPISDRWVPRDPGPRASCRVRRVSGVRPPLHCSTGGYDDCPPAITCGAPFWSRTFYVTIDDPWRQQGRKGNRFDDMFDLVGANEADVVMPDGAFATGKELHLRQARLGRLAHHSLATFGMEPPTYYKHMLPTLPMFDLSFGFADGYSHRSTYMYSDPKLLFNQDFVPFADREAAALVFSLTSNAAHRLPSLPRGAGHTRADLSNAISKLVPTHNFGDASRNRPPIPPVGGGHFDSKGPRNKRAVMRRYKFCLAVENQEVPGYVTEKLADCLAAGSIPIYHGAPSLEKWWPLHKESVIFVRDFESIDALARRVLEIASNKTLFESFLAWKSKPVPPQVMQTLFHGLGNIMCRVCVAHRRRTTLGAAGGGRGGATTWGASQQTIIGGDSYWDGP